LEFSIRIGQQQMMMIKRIDVISIQAKSIIAGVFFIFRVVQENHYSRGTGGKFETPGANKEAIRKGQSYINQKISNTSAESHRFISSFRRGQNCARVCRFLERVQTPIGWLNWGQNIILTPI
jgi:hypothetical protein